VQQVSQFYSHQDSSTDVRVFSLFHTEENFLSHDLELHSLSWLFSSGAPLSRDLNRAHVEGRLSIWV
jgi:hypothetical protein